MSAVLMLVLVVMVVQTLLRFSADLQLLGCAVVYSVLMFFSKGLGVWDKVKVPEAFLAPTSELDGHHQS